MTNRVRIDTKKLEKELNRFFKKIQDRNLDFQAIFEKQIGETYAEIVEMTPKDIGRAKSGWVIALEEKNKNIFKQRISNFVPYIVKLELGGSKQRPKGMVRVNLNKFLKLLRKQIKVLK